MSGPIADSLRAQVDVSLAQLTALMRRGIEIGNALAADPASAQAHPAARIWQHDCAALVSRLSGGSKAHWLSRAYSSALLVRSPEGRAVVDAPLTDIVGRVLGVLEQAVASLAQPGAAAASATPPLTRRFDFVHNEALRPVLEEAFLDSSRALDEGDFTRSLMTSCGILEAIITDALEHCGSRIADCGSDGGSNQSTKPAVSDPQSQSAVRDPPSAMSFESRIAAAEQRGLIRGGCVRLPPIARAYRTVAESDVEVSAHDARVVRQVLHVVIRDLDPGR